MVELNAVKAEDQDVNNRGWVINTLNLSIVSSLEKSSLLNIEYIHLESP